MSKSPSRSGQKPTEPTKANGGNFLDLPVSAVMQKDVVTVTANTPLSEVETVIADARVGGVPVTDSAGHVIGVLSLRDLVDRYASDPDARPRRSGFYHVDAEELDEEDLDAYELPEEGEETAEQVMTGQVLSVPPTATLREVARTMVKHQVHRLLVQDVGNKMVGIVSTMDIVRAMTK